MHQYLVRLLIPILSVTSAAWVLDDCYIQYTHAPSVLVSGHCGGDEDRSVCDGPCIGGFLFVAIASFRSLNGDRFLQEDAVPSTVSYYSFYNDPPFRPPERISLTGC